MSIEEALRSAADVHDGLKYIDRVKTVVRRQLSDVDPAAKIEDTHYFNHSAIPDFVVTWPGERGERGVYLRDSYASIAAGEDARYLDDSDPMLLSLETVRADARRELTGSASDLEGSAQQTEEAAESTVFAFGPMTGESGEMAETAAGPRGRALLTDVLAVEMIADAVGPDSSPMASLVKANLIRGGRGLVDEARAGVLIEASAGLLAEGGAVGDLIETTFMEDAATRISRTALLISLAMNTRGRALDDALKAIGGRLSIAELRVLLPWLLTQPAAAGNLDFWRYVGKLTQFKDIEDIGNEFEGLDLTPLIVANADQWVAKWAYVGLAAPRDDAEPELAPRWTFVGRRLAIDLGTDRLLVAHNGQLIKARESSSSATWDALRAPLASRRLAGVSLRGIRRSVTVDAEQSPDVRTDVEEISTSLEDRYFVTHATIRVPAPAGGEGLHDVGVDFGGGTVHAPAGATIRDIAGIAAEVLNFRAYPLPMQVPGLSDEGASQVAGADGAPVAIELIEGEETTD